MEVNSLQLGNSAITADGIVAILGAGVTGFAFIMLAVSAVLTWNIQSKLMDKFAPGQQPGVVNAHIRNTRFFMGISCLFFFGGCLLLMFPNRPEAQFTLVINPYDSEYPAEALVKNNIHPLGEGHATISIRSDETLIIKNQKLQDWMAELQLKLRDAQNAQNALALRDVAGNASAGFESPQLPESESGEQTGIDRAKRHIADGKYETAIAILTELKNNSRRDEPVATIDNLIGWSYFSLGRTDEAEEFLLDAYNEAKSEKDADTVIVVSNNLGVLYFVRGDLKKSLEYFSKENSGTKIASEYRGIIKKRLTEQNAEENILLGAEESKNGRFDKAVALYDKAIHTAAEEPRIYEFKGYALFRADRLPEAAATLEEGLRRDVAGKRPMIGLNLIKTYCKMGEERKADALVKKGDISSSHVKEWWKIDKELRTACEGSDYLRQL